MKQLVLIAALLAPMAAHALPTPVEDIEQLAMAVTPTALAQAPALPLAASGEASVCAMQVDPLPDVLSLYLEEPAGALMALCLTQ